MTSRYPKCFLHVSFTDFNLKIKISTRLTDSNLKIKISTRLKSSTYFDF